MRKKQTHNPLVKKDKDGLPYFVSPNRRTYRQFLAQGLETERICGARAEADSNEKEMKAFRKEIARKHGSTTGELKKKHINRERELQKQEEYLMLLNEGHKFEVDEVVKMGYTLEQAKVITEKDS